VRAFAGSRRIAELTAAMSCELRARPVVPEMTGENRERLEPCSRAVCRIDARVSVDHSREIRGSGGEAYGAAWVRVS
jgi:hypothetical protein